MLKKMALILLAVGLFFIGYASCAAKIRTAIGKSRTGSGKGGFGKTTTNNSHPEPELSFQNGQTIGSCKSL